MKALPRHHRRSLVIAVLLGAVACSGPQLSAPPTQRVATESAIGSIAPSGGTVSFPDADGYTGTFLYSVNDASAPVSVALTSRDAAIAGLPGPAPAGTMLASFTFKQTTPVTYRAWYRLLTTITIPATVRTAGHTFSEYGYDLTDGVAEGSNPGTVSGSTVSFGPGLGPVTLQAHDYAMTLVMN